MAIMTATIAAGSEILTADVISHEGGLWLVPHWWQHPTEGWMRPARIIRMDTLQHQRLFGAETDFLVKTPLPIGALDGSQAPDECSGFEVIDNPDVRLVVGQA
ncbi:hypothetical protein N6L27_03580 [Leisingera sp. SS27]|uniref:hypothetical protein n=1 Tax=Leisingera sp. SS27 TaxID=2979462 RepID=UPI00232AA653|nr:hypothetical protein [Leisingera sp. SS27]MDC0657071.1 hypothetical protein [Leisingera sp. SS27]